MRKSERAWAQRKKLTHVCDMLVTSNPQHAFTPSRTNVPHHGCEIYTVHMRATTSTADPTHPASRHLHSHPTWIVNHNSKRKVLQAHSHTHTQHNLVSARASKKTESSQHRVHEHHQTTIRASHTTHRTHARTHVVSARKARELRCTHTHASPTHKCCTRPRGRATVG